MEENDFNKMEVDNFPYENPAAQKWIFNQAGKVLLQGKLMQNDYDIGGDFGVDDDNKLMIDLDADGSGNNNTTATSSSQSLQQPPEMTTMLKEEPTTYFARAPCVERIASEARPCMPYMMQALCAKGRNWQFSSRLKTYRFWPHQMKHHIRDLARAGFSYTGRSDSVRCIGCPEREFCKWKVSDNAWSEHKRLSPTCNFLLMAGPLSIQDPGVPKNVNLTDPSYFHSRLASMENYSPQFIGETPAVLARFGFVFTGTTSTDRRLVCFMCGFELSDCPQERCHPWRTHQAKSPKCDFVRVLPRNPHL